MTKTNLTYTGGLPAISISGYTFIRAEPTEVPNSLAVELESRADFERASATKPKTESKNLEKEAN